MLLLGMIAPDLLDETKTWIRETSRRDPADAVLWTVLVASNLFFKAEVGKNPKVKTLNDAFVFVTTNLSVGYCDIYACTERGKQVASLLMIFGPALAARALDETEAERAISAAEEHAKHEALASRLDRIGDLLERGAPPPTPPFGAVEIHDAEDVEIEEAPATLRDIPR